MFAGPNGSGKSTLKTYLPQQLLGVYLNPDEIEQESYYRSLDLLMEAIRHTHRAYVFDNSGENKDRKHTWLAEITNGRMLELKSDQIPAWFKRAVLDKIMPKQ
jgi:predicted ABC-type ATPase